jgi:signal transduction histidine kinase
MKTQGRNTALSEHAFPPNVAGRSRFERMLTGRPALGLALIGFAALVVSGILMQRISTSIDEIQHRHSPALDSILKIRREISDGVRASMTYLASGDLEQKQACLDSFARLPKSMDQLATVARIQEQGEEREFRLLQDIRELQAELLPQVEELFSKYAATGRSDQSDLQTYERTTEQLLAATDKLVSLEHDEVQAVHRLAMQTITQARLGLGMVAATVVLLALAVGLVLRSAFTRAQQAASQERALRDRFVERSIAVQDSERRRVARELHDETGQALASLAIGLHELTEPTATNQPVKVAQVAKRLQKTTQNLVRDINRLVQGLHPQLIEDHGWVAAIEQLLAEFRSAHGIAVDLDLVGLDPHLRLSSERALAVYRVVQEALTNVARHAGAAHVGVCLRQQDNQLRVMIEDDGCGFELRTARLSAIGLQSMRERAGSLGGSLLLESTAQSGTTVALDFPVKT